MLNILMDSKEYQHFLRVMGSQFSHRLYTALEDIGDKNIQDTIERLETEKDVEGNPFAALSERYAAWKERNVGHSHIGILSGQMIQSNQKEINVKNDHYVLTVYNNVEDSKYKDGFYGLNFQEGDGYKQPARPFIGFNLNKVDDEIDFIFKRLYG